MNESTKTTPPVPGSGYFGLREGFGEAVRHEGRLRCFERVSHDQQMVTEPRVAKPCNIRQGGENSCAVPGRPRGCSALDRRCVDRQSPMLEDFEQVSRQSPVDPLQCRRMSLRVRSSVVASNAGRRVPSRAGWSWIVRDTPVTLKRCELLTNPGSRPVSGDRAG